MFPSVLVAVAINTEENMNTDVYKGNICGTAITRMKAGPHKTENRSSVLCESTNMLREEEAAR